MAVKRMGRVRLPEVTLEYGLWGDLDGAVVAIHGLTASHVNFAALADRLAGRRSVWAPDLRGRGLSDKPDGPYGMEQHGRDVAEAMDALGIRRAVVLGHSMGAYIGTALAARRPDLVAGLVMLDGGYLLDAPPGFDPDALLDTLLKPQVERLRTVYPSRQAYVEFWRGTGAIPPEAWNQWVEEYFDYDLDGEEPDLRSRVSEAATRADFRSMAQKPEVEERLRALTCPISVIRAEDGVAPGQPPILPDEVMAGIRACQPGIEEHLVPGSTHYTIGFSEPHITTVADLVDDFARRVMPATARSST